VRRKKNSELENRRLWAFQKHQRIGSSHERMAVRKVGFWKFSKAFENKGF